MGSRREQTKTLLTATACRQHMEYHKHDHLVNVIGALTRLILPVILLFVPIGIQTNRLRYRQSSHILAVYGSYPWIIHKKPIMWRLCWCYSGLMGNLMLWSSIGDVLLIWARPFRFEQKIGLQFYNMVYMETSLLRFYNPDPYLSPVVRSK